MTRAERDHQLAVIAKNHGAQYSLRIVLEARHAGIPISLGFALIEQESNFQNVFGHDPTIFTGAGAVTKQKYLAYKRKRGPKGAGGMQGVGPAQLTWWEYQDLADRLGGCWIAKHNIRVAFMLLAEHIQMSGTRKGIESYNGSGPAAQRYASRVLALQRKWHGRFEKES